uniref:Uncharacterized protein n=1 Tax=Serratia phage Spe5P4 TaxID=3159438 RepID=A0AAU7VIB5_9CAUD
MRVKNDHWTADQYIALVRNLFPGVTLQALIDATNSCERDVLHRLLKLGLAKPTENAPFAPGSCGWNWLNKTRRGRFMVYNADDSLMVDLFPIIKSYGWKEIGVNTIINGLYRRDQYACQIVRE